MTDLEFGTLLHELLKSINKSVGGIFRKAYSPIGITYSQARVLMIINDEGGECASGVMREKMNTPASNVTNICNRLEDGGLIEKKRRTDDRRVVRFTLTDKGREVAASIIGGFKSVVLMTADATPAGDRQAILNGLTLLRDAMASKGFESCDE